jgi:hypothetical protein
MKKISSVLIAGAMALGTTTGAFAKETADQAAERYDACNDKKFVSARYLESGQLEITCPAGSFSGNPMSQTGLTSGAAAAAGIIVLALLVGNDGSSSTTTTTTSP